MPNPNRLSRRDFLRISAATASGLVLCGCGRHPTPVPTGTPAPTNTPSTPTPTGTPLPTASPTAAPSPSPGCADPLSLAPMPPPRGQRYSATVPDTFDIQTRAELVIRAMTNCTDPQGNYAPYDNMYIWSNPPVMRGTTMSNGKYMEAAALLRHVTGSTENQHVDQSWRSAFLQAIADYPWWGCDGGRLLAWLGDNFRIEQDPCWRELGAQAVRNLSQRMVHKDNYSYYPNEQGEMPTGWEATWGGWVLQGLTVPIKGNEVVSIEPSGRWYPFYQRAHYRAGRVRWVDRERFVPDL